MHMKVIFSNHRYSYMPMQTFKKISRTIRTLSTRCLMKNKSNNISKSGVVTIFCGASYDTNLMIDFYSFIKIN